METHPRSPYRSPVFITLVAFAFRLGVMAYKHAYEFSPSQDHFNFGYEMGRVARSIVSGQGFSSPFQGSTGPTAYLPPLYPYLIAGVFKVFGIYTATSALVLMSLDCLFSALTCLTVFLIGQRTFATSVGVWSAWIWTFLPSATFWSRSTDRVWETSLSTFLFSCVFLLMLSLEGSRRSRDWLGFGLLWGLAGLSNPALLSFLPFSLGWLWYQWRRRGTGCARLIALATSAFIFSVSPWLVRNYLVLGRPVFIRDGLGLQLFLGNHDGLTNRPWEVSPGVNGTEMQEYERLGELAYMADKQHKALTFIHNHPVAFTWLTLKRSVNYWLNPGALTYGYSQEGAFGLVRAASYPLLSILAFLGVLFAALNRNPRALLFVATLLSFSSIYCITLVSPRFRRPIEPHMCCLSAYALMDIRQRRRCVRPLEI